ncbi:phosphosulfolactate synthase [Pelotomaculum terephthalicicum JT]|uniref:phosphosulfolactate synthase n=1 Tax=Pelotomaculum TaxID=191373 RepID=UPI0009D40629|nr:MULTISPECIES: phosphosulfolactate synthase [Pelotomaculum]MCG9967097.1 phosphosulfolactate synthase [Pelotomaculum terephthalicicum JT]OPX87805.1 MAG: Phosphosulfolactate synthase [Pelotomaculum sp. PtaB.Bin117]OPY63857.1 MAG: Phosphosulfolactate synthase [Pelotomaculum sp. PtaU1.Bin065]
MGENSTSNAWLEILRFPLDTRSKKPRHKGLTMLLDKGLGPEETKDLFHAAGDYIDFLKLGFGTSALYPQKALEAKIDLAKQFNVDIYPGGTFLEIAIMQDKLKEFLMLAKALGYTAVEVSDGTLHISPEVRARTISLAAEKGFKVLTEIGKKNPLDRAPIEDSAEQIQLDLKNGAYKVIVEGRESGKNTGFYDGDGHFTKEHLALLLSAVESPELLIWEAPLKEQQQELILRFGPDVNLGNIPPREVIALEALRVGLRSDTLRSVI